MKLSNKQFERQYNKQLILTLGSFAAQTVSSKDILFITFSVFRWAAT